MREWSISHVSLRLLAFTSWWSMPTTERSSRKTCIRRSVSTAGGGDFLRILMCGQAMRTGGAMGGRCLQARRRSTRSTVVVGIGTGDASDGNANSNAP